MATGIADGIEKYIKENIKLEQTLPEDNTDSNENIKTEDNTDSNENVEP